MANEQNPTRPEDGAGDDGTRLLPPYNTDDYRTPAPAQPEQPSPTGPSWQPPSYSPPAQQASYPPAGTPYAAPESYQTGQSYQPPQAQQGTPQGTPPPPVPGQMPSYTPSYPTSAPSAPSYPMAPTGQQPPQGAGTYGQHPGYAQGAPRPRDDSPLSALADFGFTRYATPGLVKIVYILSVVAGVGSWLLSVLSAFAANSLFGGGAGSGFILLLFGWIPAALFIAVMRFTLEFYLVNIRTNAKVTEILEHLQRDSRSE